MIIGSMKEVSLTRAKEICLFDCRVARLDPQALDAYNNTLGSFILFTGDLRVKQLIPDHVHMYISNLSDGPNEREDHHRLVMSQCVLIQTWIQWIHSQESIIERTGSSVKPPRLTSPFPSQFTRSLTNCWI